VDDLGNEVRQRKRDLKGNSSKMQNNVSVTSSIGKTAISQVVFLSSGLVIDSVETWELKGL
jgi:hypothetical protein